MNSKERMLTALNMGIPDRLPVTIHQWMPYHLRHYMNGMDQIEAFRYFGMDAAVTVFDLFYYKQTNDWKDRVVDSKTVGDETTTYHEITTPRGTLTYVYSSNEQTGWYVEPIIKQPDDIYLFRDYYPRIGIDKERAKKIYDTLGDSGILRACVPDFQGGCFQATHMMAGTQTMIYACYDDPDWVHEFLKILVQRRLEFILEEMRDVKFDLVENGGGGGSDTVISPKMHKEFCLPYDKMIHDALHSINIPVVYHTCGGMMSLLDIIPENGCDASETLSPPSIGGNMRREDRKCVKETLGKKVALIGGMDQFNILTTGTIKQIQDEVQNLFETFGEGGGYIMSACDHFFDAPKENLRAFAAAAKMCVYK
jgi:hypothetical protein